MGNLAMKFEFIVNNFTLFSLEWLIPSKLVRLLSDNSKEVINWKLI